MTVTGLLGMGGESLEGFRDLAEQQDQIVLGVISSRPNLGAERGPADERGGWDPARAGLSDDPFPFDVVVADVSAVMARLPATISPIRWGALRSPWRADTGRVPSARGTRGAATRRASQG